MVKNAVAVAMHSFKGDKSDTMECDACGTADKGVQYVQMGLYMYRAATLLTPA